MGTCAQYPAEKEITFPPFTCLESDGDPRVERTEEGETVIFPLKATSQPRTPCMACSTHVSSNSSG